MDSVASVFAEQHEFIDEGKLVAFVIKHYRSGMSAAALKQHVERAMHVTS